MKKRLLILFALLSLIPVGCTSTPEGIEPVRGFEVDRYLGTWYEVARLDHSFERGLDNVTAEYSMRDDGDIRVINRGYNQQKGAWQHAEGRAKFLEGPDTGSLKVTFFGPFYGGYHIIELDRQRYGYAMIAGNDRDYLWILSRTPEMKQAVRVKLVDSARKQGFDTDALIHVDQSRH